MISCGLQLTQNTTHLTSEEQDDIVNGKEEEVVVLEKKHEIVIIGTPDKAAMGTRPQIWWTQRTNG